MINFFFKSGMSVYDVISSIVIGTLAGSVSWFFLLLVIPSAALSAYIEKQYVAT